MTEPELAVVYSPREWANRVVRHVTDHGGGRVRLRVVDGRVALEEDFDILVAEDVTSFLTGRFVTELHRRGRAVLGVYDPEEPAGKERLLDLGVDDLIESSAPAEDFVRKLALILPERPSPPRRPLVPAHGVDAELASIAAGMRAPASVPRPRGWQWAVGGPPGGCGASEVAVELARHLRSRSGPAVLVDGQDISPSLAQRLGQQPIPNIRTAIDAVLHGSGELAGALLPVAAGGFALLAGLTNPADWGQIRAQDAADVVQELRSQCAHVVVNVGPILEDLPAAGGPDRYGLTRALTASADVIIGVGLPTPVGVARLIGWVAEVATLAPGRPIHLVVNRAPANRFIRAEVEAEIRRTYAPASVHFLPYDEAVEKAAWRGELVAPGPFSRAVGDLVEATGAAATPAAAAPRPRRHRVARGS
ncbi:MAG TPA: hypothetical protein VFW71_10620 [Actinomycetota bacterium]|nr:hypothetical protein [Actinomycetota bacterium]